MGIQRYSIIYSSKTGNTKKLAEKIREVLPEENCDYFGTEGAKAFSSDTLYIGFWTDIGNADPVTLELLKSLKNKYNTQYSRKCWKIPFLFFSDLLNI